MKAVCYLRVSTDKQGIRGLGMEAQQNAVVSFTSQRNAEIIATFTEVESGKKDDRPELEKALRRCRLTGATLVIAKLDRLSRDIEFIARMQKSSVDFICCDMPEANTLTIGLMAVMAEHERESISIRTKAALAAKKARGERLGNPDLHLYANTDTTAATAARVKKAKERNAELQTVISEMEAEYREINEGREMTSRELAKALNAAEYTTARGKPFSHTQALRVKNAC